MTVARGVDWVVGGYVGRPLAPLAPTQLAPSPDFVDRMYDDFDTPTRKAVLKLYRASPPSAMEQLSAGLRALDRPALVVWGAKDPCIPVEQADLQLRTFPAAEVHVLDDSGHWPFIDNPERTRELVVPFVRRVVGS